MQAFGESFREAVGESLCHDRVIVVVLGPEPVAQLLQSDSAGHRERADMIGQARFLGAIKSARDRQGSLPSLFDC